MLARLSVLLLIAGTLAACSESTAGETTAATPTSTTAVASTTTGGPEPSSSSSSTTTTTVPEQCGAIPYAIGTLPSRVDSDRLPPDDAPQDPYTTIPGTRSDLWLDEEGELAVAFVRGALPPEEWPGERGEVSIDGARGVAGPFEDGSWVVAWFEADGDRCDRYFMVFYPPVEPAEVEATVGSLDRTAG